MVSCLANKASFLLNYQQGWNKINTLLQQFDEHQSQRESVLIGHLNLFAVFFE